MPLGVVGVLAAGVLRAAASQGRPGVACDLALEALVSTDCMLRAEEADGLKVGHVVCGGGRVAVLLGVDKPTKTGRREGTVVHDKGLQVLLREAVEGRSGCPDEALFSTSRAEFAGWLGRAAEAWGLLGVTPHVLRHTGASFFGGVLGWPASDLLLRGRWKHLSSVQRYVKPHVLVESWARLPKELARLARAFEQDPVGFLESARIGLPSGPAPGL